MGPAAVKAKSMPLVNCMPGRARESLETFLSSMNSNWPLALVPVSGGGWYMISVMASGGVAAMKVATVGADQQLLIGGLRAPVRL